MDALTLDNGEIQIQMAAKGAELTSLRRSGGSFEYIWQADLAIWPRHAPVLFPIVGRLKDDHFSWKGQSYAVSQHGFARDAQFQLHDRSPKHAEWVLKYSNETLTRFPFNFSLYIAYRLEGASVRVSYRIVNTGHEEMFFSIGAHPGFNCPTDQDVQLKHYYIEFDQMETASRHILTNGLFNGQTESVLVNSNRIYLSDTLFDRDAVIFKDLQSTVATLGCDSSDRKVQIAWKDFPYLGIWSKPKAPFVCIEPWVGLADTAAGYRDLSKKEGIRSLNMKEDFTCYYTITIS